MIKSLRRKFMAMTMSMISAVLLIVFGALLISTYNQQLSAIKLSLEQAVGARFGFESGRQRFGRDAGTEMFTNTVSALVDESGERIYTNDDMVSITDDELDAAIEMVLAAGADEGRLSGLGLYYRREAAAARQMRLDQPDEGERRADAPEWEGRHEAGEMPELPDGERPQPPEFAESGEMPITASALNEALEEYDDDARLYKIALASDSGLRSAMRGLILSSLIVGAAALLVLFVICLYLSGWALRPVERTWNQQKAFISDASHELKTPLTVILANMDIIKKHGNETVAEQMRWIDNTRDEAGRMKDMVEDLLTLARLDEAGQTAPALEMSEVNLTDAVWGEALTFEPIAFEMGLALESDIADGVTVRGDEKKLRQLTAILLDNACKYAGKGGRIDVKLAKIKDKAVLSVRNTGEAIPAENLEHLFDRFYRADKARTGEKAGFGLGLSIAAGIARVHGGSIRAASSEKDGTVFTVEI